MKLRNTLMTSAIATLMALASSSTTMANKNYWSELPTSYANRNVAAGKVLADRYRSVKLNVEALRGDLRTAPLKNQVQLSAASTLVDLPTPDGGFMSFRVLETPMMEEALALKYPMIKTYTAVATNNPNITAKLDMGPYGFNAMVFAPEGRFFIEPLNNKSDQDYVVFYRKDINPAYHSFSCNTSEDLAFEEENKKRVAEYRARASSVPVQFRNYRLALACTLEYSAAATSTANPTREQVLAKMVTSMNRVNGVYETDVAVTMTLIANTDTLIFLPGSSDPYSNNDGFAMLQENQNTVTARIGNANYDIGHVFSTGGGGIAGLGVVCVTGSKARGVTGSPSPVGDAFDIDYVAHEMGHQFAGNHTFNSQTGSCGGGNRNATTAMEPGSGTTIMAYAGICGADDIRPNSDPFFHAISLDEINAFITSSSGNTCPVKTTTTNNPPVVEAGPNYSIPLSTPFILTGSATDPDGNSLTYSWEQMDIGPAGAPNSPTGNAPLFRFFPPVSSPSRTFPKLNDILTNTQVKGERLPSYARSMKFRLTARDNQPQAGATGKDEMTVTVVGTAGPFNISSSNVVDTFLAGGSEVITWNVANTNLSPINCSLVRILLSTDNGLNFNTILADNTPNDGSEVIVVPNISSTTARIKIEAVGNIFFDINNAQIRILAPTGPDYTVSAINSNTAGYCAPDSVAIEVGVNPVLGFADSVTLTALNLPAGSVASFSKNPLKPGETSTLKITTAGVSVGSKNVTVSGTSNAIIRNSVVNYLILTPVTAQASVSAPVNSQANVNPNFNFTWAVVTNATSYQVQIATDTTFNNIIVDSTLNGNNATTFRSSNLPNYTKLFVRVRAGNACGQASFSTINGFTTTGVPLAPTNLNLVSNTATSVTIRWTDNSSNENAYRVERSEGNDSTFLVVGNLTANATQYISNNLTAGVTYYFRVRAANTIGNSAYSNVLMVPFLVGIERSAFEELSIYPNPSASQFTLTVKDQSLGKLSYKVMDELGRVVYSNELMKNQPEISIPIDLSNQANGVYFIQLTSEQKSSTARMLKIN